MSKLFLSLLSSSILFSPTVESFRRKKDMKMYEVSFQIGVSKDEIIIGEPVIFYEGSIPVECHCDQRAHALTFKKDGSLESLCRKHYNDANGFEPVSNLPMSKEPAPVLKKAS